MRSGDFGWVRPTALVGLVSAMILMVAGFGGVGLLLIVPFALVVDSGIVRGVRRLQRCGLSGQ